MKLKKIILPSLGLGALILTGTLGVHSVRAADTNTNPPIIQLLAEKFGLNQDDVAQVFDQERQQQQQRMQVDRETHLEQAVTDGVITEDQRQLILQHQEEMAQQREEHRQQQQQWAEDNGIDMDALHSYGMGGGRGPKPNL